MARFAEAKFTIRAINKTQKTFAQIDQGVGRMERRFGRLGSFITKRFIPALIAIKGVRFAGGLADEFINIENRLKVVSKSSEEVKSAFAGVAEVAKTTQSSLSGTANLYSRLVIATKDLNLSQKEQLKLTQALNQTFRISGATTMETAAASIQLAQGLASGRLAGDELRSVLENNVVLGQLLAEAFNTDVGTLRDLAAEGKITGKVVSDILLKNFDDLNQQASKIAPTFSRIGQVIRDQFGIGFISQTKESFSTITTGLSENSDRFRKFGEVVGRVVNFVLTLFEELVKAVQFVGQAFEPVFSVIGQALLDFMTLVEQSIPLFKLGFQGMIAEVIKFGNLFIAVFKGVGDAFNAFGEQISKRFEALGKDLAAFIEDPLGGISFDNTREALETGLLEAMDTAFEKALDEARDFNKAIDAEMEDSADKLVNSMKKKTDAVEKLFKKGEELTKKTEESQGKLEKKTEETTDSIEKDFEKLGEKVEGDLVGALDAIGGKFDSFGDFAKSVLSDINQTLIKFALKDLGITGEGGFIRDIFGGLGGLFGGGGGGSGGGGIGSLFSGIGSFFGGFFADGGKLKPGQFGVVGERGPELAFTGSSPLNIMPGGMGAAPVTVNMNIQTPDAQSFRQSQSQIAADMARSIERARRNL